MNVNSSYAKDLPQLIEPRRLVDSRGWFSETYREDKLASAEISCRFVQENQSFSQSAGTLRGLHFQLPPTAQAKIVTVLQGLIFDVAVDIRRASPTYGKYVSTELSAASGRQLYIPIGFAHGFLTLQDETVVMYKVSDYYSPADDCGIRWNDPDIACPWPMKGAAAIVSEKDARLPFLKEFDSPFAYDGHPLEPLASPRPL